MQDLELSSICVGYFIICESPNWEVRKSSSEPSKLVLSAQHQSLDFITATNGLPHKSAHKFNFIFDLNISNSSCILAGRSIEMNEATNFITYAYFKSNAFTKIWNIQNSQRKISPVKDTDASSFFIGRMFSA